jgi:hypothetical protein
MGLLDSLPAAERFIILNLNDTALLSIVIPLSCSSSLLSM